MVCISVICLKAINYNNVLNYIYVVNRPRSNIITITPCRDFIKIIYCDTVNAGIVANDQTVTKP